MNGPASIDALCAFAQHWNRLADSAYEQIAAMRMLGCSESLVADAELAAGRNRGIAARLDELVGHLKAD